MNPNKKFIRVLTIVLLITHIICILLIIFGILFCLGIFNKNGGAMLVPGLPMIGAAGMIFFLTVPILLTLTRAKRAGKENPNKTFFNTAQTVEEAETTEYYGGSVNEQLSKKYKGNLKCPKCGARRSSHARFCEYCGEPFTPSEKDGREDPYGK